MLPPPTPQSPPADSGAGGNAPPLRTAADVAAQRKYARVCCGVLPCSRRCSTAVDRSLFSTVTHRCTLACRSAVVFGLVGGSVAAAVVGLLCGEYLPQHPGAVHGPKCMQGGLGIAMSCTPARTWGSDDALVCTSARLILPRVSSARIPGSLIHHSREAVGYGYGYGYGYRRGGIPAGIQCCSYSLSQASGAARTRARNARDRERRRPESRSAGMTPNERFARTSLSQALHGTVLSRGCNVTIRPHSEQPELCREVSECFAFASSPGDYEYCI